MDPFNTYAYIFVRIIYVFDLPEPVNVVHIELNLYRNKKGLTMRKEMDYHTREKIQNIALT